MTIFTQFFITLFIVTVILIFCLFAGQLLLSQYTWYASDLLYRILNGNEILLLVSSWLVCFAVIFLIYWKRTLGFIDKIAAASNQLVDTNDTLIHLPVELKQVEDRMNQIKQEANRNARFAREAEQRKNDLIVYLAHDLKTPLTSVIGYLTLLRDEQQISPELQQKYLSISLQKAERLEDLINEFFEITRFNLSQLSLETSSVNLTRMIEQIAYEFTPLFKHKNIQYELEMLADIEIKCDIEKIQRVFDNLIRNAITYSFENSVISILATKEPEGVSLCFKNQGNTIPKDKLNRIFEQFYRLDNARSTKTGEAGLGLAIAKQIIELHNGTITASSENETIEFNVYLPFRP